MEKPNNVYCNLSFYCKKQNINDSDVQASFESNRNTPILENASDYEMSIAKLDIESQNIPILIPSIDTTQNNINLTNYQIQVIHNNVSIADAVNLQYSSRNKYKFSVPTVAGADSPYYYIYDIQQVVDMFNSACVEAVSGLSVSAPFMTYNNNNTFSIYFDELFETDYTFCVNDYLYNLFRNFSYNYIQNNQINYSILVTNKNYINRVTLNSVVYTVETQLYSSFSVDWSPVSSIVLTSNSLPIVSEEIIPAVNLSGLTFNSSNDSEQQITDIVLSIDNPNDYNNIITYVATSNYRRISLNAREVRQINIKILWRSKQGILYPLMLSDGNSCSLKLKFERIKK